MSPSSSGRTPSAASDPFVAEGPITRTVADAALVLQSLSGFDARDPYSLPDVPDFVGALDGDLQGVRIAYSPDFGVYPIDPRVATVVAEAVRAFEAAGAVVEEVHIPIPYDQRELSDLWCRLITPLNIETFEGFKAAGLDLLRDHRDRFPPEYLRWIDAGYRASVTDRLRDQTMRTAVCDAIGAILATYDFIVTPDAGGGPGGQRHRRQHGRTERGQWRGGGPAHRLVPDLLLNFSGHPAASIPAGLIDGRLPVGMQIVGRQHDDAGVLKASAVFERLRPWAPIYQLCRDRPLG